MAIDWLTKVYDESTGKTIYQKNTVNHLVNSNRYICSLNYGGTLVWTELYGKYTTGDLPNGVASLTCFRTSKDPSISAGTLSDGEHLYRYDTLVFSGVASGYYDITVANPTVTLTPTLQEINHLYTPLVSPSLRETTLNGVTTSGVSATAQMFTLKATMFGYNRGDTFTMTYYDSTGTQKTFTETYYPTQTTAPVITSLGVKCWRGGQVTWDCTPGSSYWQGYSGTVAIAAQSKDTTKTVTAMRRKTRTVRFYKVTGVASYSVTYTNSSGTRTTVTRTPTGTYSTITAFIGATVTWTATATSGYTVSPSSGTIAASTSTTAVSVKPTATVAKSWKEYPDEYEGGSNTWSTWSNNKTAAAGIVDDTNITSYDKSRITGKITVTGKGGGSASFSAVELSETAYTAVTTCFVSQEVMGFVITDTYTLYVKGDDYLTAYIQSADGTILATVTVSVTKLEVYG